MSADALLSAIETEFITKDVAMNNRMASVELSLIRKIFCGRSKDIKYIYIPKSKSLFEYVFVGTLLDPIFFLFIKTLSHSWYTFNTSRESSVSVRIIGFLAFGDTRRGRLFECRRSRRRKATKSEIGKCRRL